MTKTSLELAGLGEIPGDVRLRVAEKLADIESRFGVRILYACESGSRGWGFASADSDYDVRFIYVHPLPWYLTVRPGRDVIELPIDDDLDINGWELRKALGLLAKGNPVLVEWLHSPLVYRCDEVFLDAMRESARGLFQPGKSIHHYLHMAQGNYREYLQGDTVRLKKYLYVLRPILAARWVATKGETAPMEFSALVAGMVADPALRRCIDKLVAIKRTSGEAEYGPRFPEINAYIEAELEGLRKLAPAAAPAGDAMLDRLLLDTVLRLDQSLLPPVALTPSAKCATDPCRDDSLWSDAPTDRDSMP